MCASDSHPPRHIAALLVRHGVQRILEAARAICGTPRVVVAVDAELLAASHGQQGAFLLDDAIVAQAERRFRSVPVAELASAVSATRLPNAQGRTITLSTYHCPPFSYRDAWGHDPPGRVAAGATLGVEMSLAVAASAALGLQWRLHDLPAAQHWGHLLPNGSYSGGLLWDLSSGEADIAFCAIFLHHEQAAVSDIGFPWGHVCTGFLVPRLLPPAVSAVVRPFPAALWACLLAATAAVAAVLCALHAAHHKLTGERSVYTCMVESVLTVSGMLWWSGAAPARLVGRPLLGCWWLVCLLTGCLYCSRLFSTLTAPQELPPLDSVAAMVRHGCTWGMPTTMKMNKVFSLEVESHRRLAGRFRLEPRGLETRVARVLSGSYAVPGVWLVLGGEPFFQEKGDPLNDADDGVLRRLRLCRECVLRYPVGLAFRKRSPLREPFEVVQSRLLQAGILGYWHRDVVRRSGDRRYRCVLRQDWCDRSASAAALRLHSLVGPVAVLGAGCLLAAALLLWELLQGRQALHTSSLRHRGNAKETRITNIPRRSNEWQ